jgi:NAD(P)-dependent dehydrogenase (short-subunit alcohol dehydrogenase family)
MSMLAGRRIFVVGASSGIGRACALAFVRNGARVVMAARRRELLDATVTEAGGGDVVEIDVTNHESIIASVDKAATVLDGFDAVLYTAGMSPLGKMTELSAEQWQTIFAVNTFGPNLLCAAALQHMTTDAIFAVMSSDSASQPRHSLVPYAAAKAALETTMEGWRTEELGGRRFMTIVVGPTQPSGFGDHFEPERFGELIPHWQRQGFRTGQQHSDDVAAHLVSTFASLFTAPTLGLETLLLRAPEPHLPLADYGVNDERNKT